MTFSIYALLSEQSPVTTSETLAHELQAFFQDDEEFSLSFEQLPFAKTNTLALRWGDWMARVAYEDGEAARDAAEMAAVAGGEASTEAGKSCRRIRVVFGNDPDRAHTNHMVFLLDFLRGIPGVRLFDPQKQEFFSHGPHGIDLGRQHGSH